LSIGAKLCRLFTPEAAQTCVESIGFCEQEVIRRKLLCWMDSRELIRNYHSCEWPGQIGVGPRDNSIKTSYSKQKTLNLSKCKLIPKQYHLFVYERTPHRDSFSPTTNIRVSSKKTYFVNLRSLFSRDRRKIMLFVQL
jgi:hypothetical protein